MGGGELGKFFLDPLQEDVREDTWNDATNRLNPVVPHPPQQQRINNIDYNYTYNITDIPGTTLRKVVAEIGWNETQP
jgi:hypothetical protein